MKTQPVTGDYYEKLTRIKKSFLNIPVVPGSNGYPYVLLSLTDSVPPMDPDLIEDMADLLVLEGDFSNVDIIVSEADRGGGPLTHAVALRTGTPYVLANWYPNGIRGETKVKTSIGFSGEGHIYLNSLKKGQKAIVIDDLLSSGGTVDAIISALKGTGVLVKETLFVGEKLGIGGRERILKNHKIQIKSLVQFCIKDGKTCEPD
ncbi:MAG: phosphoribosyltransferase family protein [Candidatus Dojkabacteria bacterium]|nr:phosphoribosyltransferase family protein [Candidatus Dojkabacteria bacterium]